MKINGAWVGWGLGDNHPTVTSIRQFLTTKFAWARALNLGNSPLFDQQLVDATVEMQRRYQIPATGTWNWKTQVTSGFVKVQPVDARPMLFTVCGTGVPWWVGPDADVARAVEDRYRWQPIGYPAQPFPMGPSVVAGRAELCTQVERWREEIINRRKAAAMIGYSQGAIVVSECWLFDILPSNGRLHWLLPYLNKVCTFGNPMREQGKAWADAGGPTVGPDSHGIADQLMTNTPEFWRDYAHKDDLYTDCSGQAAENKTAIYKIVMGTRMLQGPDSILAQVLELGQGPAEAMAMMQAILDAGLFFARQTGPHINYSPTAAIDYLRAA